MAFTDRRNRAGAIDRHHEREGLTGEEVRRPRAGEPHLLLRETDGVLGLVHERHHELDFGLGVDHGFLSLAEGNDGDILTGRLLARDVRLGRSR